MKKAYALFQKDKLVGCFFARSKAVHLVDEHLGNGLFSPQWIDNKKGDYEIVPCEVYYDKLYTVEKRDKSLQMFSSIDELYTLLKKNNIKIKKKMVRPTTFEIVTERGSIKGRIIQVK